MTTDSATVLDPATAPGSNTGNGSAEVGKSLVLKVTTWHPIGASWGFALSDRLSDIISAAGVCFASWHQTMRTNYPNDDNFKNMEPEAAEEIMHNTVHNDFIFLQDATGKACSQRNSDWQHNMLGGFYILKHLSSRGVLIAGMCSVRPTKNLDIVKAVAPNLITPNLITEVDANNKFSSCVAELGNMYSSKRITKEHELSGTVQLHATDLRLSLIQNLRDQNNQPRYKAVLTVVGANNEKVNNRMRELFGDPTHMPDTATNSYPIKGPRNIFMCSYDQIANIRLKIREKIEEIAAKKAAEIAEAAKKERA